MALTRRALKAMGIEDEKIDEIITMHTETVDGLKADVAFQSTHPARGATANFTKEQRVCLAQFAYLHKGKKAEHTKTNAPMLH